MKKHRPSKKRVFIHSNNLPFKDTNKYNPTTGVSGFRLFWDSSKKGTYIRSNK